MSIKWSEKIVMHFLELYKAHECLWNYRLDLYKNRDAREHALKKIVRALGVPKLTTADLKNKIKSIRTMYKKEYSLVQKSKNNGAGADDIYVPRLFWFKTADEFLNGVTNTRGTSSNIVSKDSEHPESKVRKYTPGTLDYMITVPIASPSSYDKTANTTEEFVHVVHQESSDPQPSKLFRYPTTHKRNTVHDITTAIKKHDKVVEKNTKETENEFEIFGKLVASQLKQMPLYDATICQEKVQAVLRQKRLELLMRNQRPGTSTPTTSASSTMDDDLCHYPFSIHHNHVNEQQEQANSEQSSDNEL